jgi:hypothetical protein
LLDKLVGVAETLERATLHLIDETRGAVVFDYFRPEADGDSEVSSLKLDLVSKFEHSGFRGIYDSLTRSGSGLGVEAHVSSRVEASLARGSDMGFEADDRHWFA